MSGYGVVIPTFNAAATIAETLRSITAQTKGREHAIAMP